MDLAPIALFVYNRFDHTLQTLEALSKNKYADQSTLFVFSDGPRENATEEEKLKIQRLRDLVRKKSWCQKVILFEHDRNLGFSQNIVTGITKMFDQFEHLIVLEDDIVTSSGFLQYMNEALALYRDNNEVMHINAFNFPIDFNSKDESFFLKGITCPWGWATWKRAWKHFAYNTAALVNEIGKSEENIYTFNFNGHVDHFSLIDKSWDIQWYASVFSHSGYSLWPVRSLVNNIGHDGSGVHCPPSDIYENDDLEVKLVLKYIKVQEDHDAYERILDFYRKANKKTLFTTSKNLFKKILTNVYGRF